MKRTLITGFIAVGLTGAGFGQAGNQGTTNPAANQGKTQGQPPKDDTNFQKGNPDPTDPTKQPGQNKKGKDKSGKNNKDGVPRDRKGTPGKGTPTVPNPDPIPNPNPAAPSPTR